MLKMLIIDIHPIWRKFWLKLEENIGFMTAIRIMYFNPSVDFTEEEFRKMHFPMLCRNEVHSTRDYKCKRSVIIFFCFFLNFFHYLQFSFQSD